MNAKQRELAINEDFDWASVHAETFHKCATAVLASRALCYTDAVAKFSEFLKLPAEEDHPKLKALLEMANIAICLVQPELFLVKFLGSSEALVKAAIKGNNGALTGLGRQVGTRTAKVAVAAAKAKEAGGKAAELTEGVQKGLGLIDRIQAAAKKLAAAAEEIPAGAAKLAELNASRTIRDRIVGATATALAIWQYAVADLVTAKYHRLGDPKALLTPTLLEAMQSSLKLLPKPTQSELDEVEKLYFYEMVRQHARTLTIVKRIRTEAQAVVGGYDTTSTTYENPLNNSQTATLMFEFGPSAKRGKIFAAPPIKDVVQQLIAWGATVKEVRTYKPMTKW